MLRTLLLLMLLLAGSGARAHEGGALLPFEPAVCPTAALSAPCGQDWTWIEISDLRPLAGLSSGWHLLVDQTRFSAIHIEVVHDGRITTVQRSGALQDNWSLGGKFRFEVPVPGRQVDALRIGFENIDSPKLLRDLQALSPAAHAAHMERWVALIAFVSGVLACSLVYNLFLLTWLRTAFQGWYVAWVATAIAYVLVWTGGIYYVLPGLAGLADTRLIYALVGVLIATGSCFFISLIEPGKLPRWLVTTGYLSAVAVSAAGVIAATDLILPMYLNDRLLNYAFILAMLFVAVGAVVAIRNGSRAVRFYLIGWTPPFLVFGLRVVRNFGFMATSELIDMASFSALAFEAAMLSLAIADRFRTLRRERDAAEIERQTLRRAAETDALTGLANRAVFQDRLTRLGSTCADLVVVDLDYLKETNDTAGHGAGDALIVEAGRRLHAAAGANALVARIGGDEFAVLLEGDACAALAAVLREVERSTSTALRHEGRMLPLLLSAGHARWNPDGPNTDDPARLYKNADLALYRAKADGRGRWHYCTDAMRDEQEAGRHVVAEAHAGLARGEFELHYQPVIELRTGEPIGQEALLRWWHPARGLLTPPAFAAAFADSSLAAALQSFVLDSALDHAAQLHATVTGRMRVGVNFMAMQLQGEGAAEAILAHLANRRIPPGNFVVEVTESVAIGRGGGPVVECLRCLRAAGVAVALDDFGTGYASLVHLRDFPADILKIDRSFVAGLPDDSDSQKIVRAIIALAHGLGKRVVAEGIETETQRDYLRRLGCDAAQGYLLGYPARTVAQRGRRVTQVA